MTRPPVRGDDDWSHEEGWYDDEDADWADDPAADDPAYEDAEADVDAAGEPAFEYVQEYEELPPETSRGRRALVVLAIVVGFFVIVLAGAAYFIRGQLDPSGPVGAEVRFTIPTGTSANEVASLLEDQGIIEDAQVFRWYLRFKGQDSFFAGDYVLHENMAAWDVLAVLRTEPLPIEVASFTVPEGLTLQEIPGAITDDIPGYDAAVLAQIIANMEVRPLLIDPSATSLEGYLFPDTYEVEPGNPERDAIQRMADQFDAVATQIDLVNRAAALGRSVNEIVTIASLIQEEYGIPEEMPKISRVIYNRLEIGEPLGIDATSRYLALITTGDRNDVDFDIDSPYNTRRHQGLPPTPIAAPGRAALEAALAPADGPWIYYVRDPDTSRTPEGGHFFTDSAREFAEVKNECEDAGLGCG